MVAQGISVDYINPFIEAAITTLDKMAQVSITREKIFLKGEGDEVYGVSGIIGLGGEVSGSMVLHFSESMAIKLINRVLSEDNDSINSNVVDGVSELANIITGNAKSRLVQMGHHFDIGLPRVVTGRNYITSQSKTNACLVVSFKSDFGRMNLEVSFRKKR